MGFRLRMIYQAVNELIPMDDDSTVDNQIRW